MVHRKGWWGHPSRVGRSNLRARAAEEVPGISKPEEVNKSPGTQLGRHFVRATRPTFTTRSFKKQNITIATLEVIILTDTSRSTMVEELNRSETPGPKIEIPPVG